MHDRPGVRGDRGQPAARGDLSPAQAQPAQVLLHVEFVRVLVVHESGDHDHARSLRHGMAQDAGVLRGGGRTERVEDQHRAGAVRYLARLSTHERLHVLTARGADVVQPAADDGLGAREYGAQSGDPAHRLVRVDAAARPGEHHGLRLRQTHGRGDGRRGEPCFLRHLVVRLGGDVRVPLAAFGPEPSMGVHGDGGVGGECTVQAGEREFPHGGGGGDRADESRLGVREQQACLGEAQQPLGVLREQVVDPQRAHEPLGGGLGEPRGARELGDGHGAVVHAREDFQPAGRAYDEGGGQLGEFMQPGLGGGTGRCHVHEVR